MTQQGRYDHYSREDLIRILERRDGDRRYGLVWEREGIEADRAANHDFVALQLDPALSTAPTDARGWRNLIIEGDNWDALRALRVAYTGRVKCILIDPPYNTGGRDFTYNDRYIGATDRYRQSLWLEFLWRRIVLARDLLAPDGVMLVCINDENRARLDLLLEQALPGMRIGSFVWRTKDTNNSDKKRNWSGVHEHILVYAGSEFGFIGPDAGPGKFRHIPELGDIPVRLDPITKGETFRSRSNTYYPIQNPKTGLWYPCAPNQVWRFWSETRPPRVRPRDVSIETLIRNGEINFPVEKEPPFFYADRMALDTAIASGDVPVDGRRRPLLRADLPDLDFWIGKPIGRSRLSRIVRWTAEDETATRPVGSWIAGQSEAVTDDDVQTLRSDRQGTATTEIEQIFGEKVFSFPKPTSLIRALVRSAAGDGDIVMDFFAGSGTTAHAALALNAEDDADRRFILVSSTEATEAEPGRNICRDVCAERIRRAIAGTRAAPLAGDFAYLRTKRIDWDDVVYDLEAADIWTMIQLRYGRPVLAFDPASPLQLSLPAEAEAAEPAVAYLPVVDDDAIQALGALLRDRVLVIHCPVPDLLRDRMDLLGVPVEQTPDRLLAEFPRVVAGV
ncbi:MAG: site-specific DNA-methyltransferase [Alphaproteobacteria bacterium]|nr:site-specific DNA-methyltransferase [Alphaproteobacteria bacterium]